MTLLARLARLACLSDRLGLPTRRRQGRDVATTRPAWTDAELARAFGAFEADALATVLEAVADALGCSRGRLRPRDRLPRDAESRRRVARALAERGLAIDLEGARTLRALAGRAVPLLERRPRAHH